MSVTSSVRLSVRPSVRPFSRKITFKLCKASSWHFIGRYISLRKSVVHKNQNSKRHTCGVTALCWFSYLNFVRSITFKLCKASTWHYIGRWISLRRSAVHKNHNSKGQTFGVIALSSFSFLNFVSSKIQEVFKLLTWNFIDRYTCTSLKRNAVHENHNSRHYTLRVIALCWFSYLNFAQRIFYTNVICFGLYTHTKTLR